MTRSRSSWKKFRLLLIIVILVGIVIQFFRPRLDNPPVKADLTATPAVKAILERACYDCHSNQTKLAWFDLPNPAYWLVVKDVEQGRKVLNFSDWDSLPKPQQAAKLYESIMQIEQQGMPLSNYKLLHHGGKVSPEEIAILKQYALTLAYHPKPDTAREQAQLDQYAKWMKTVITPADIKNEHNGIGYADLAGFSNWKAVSTTERFDNGTLRLILGNDVVIKAIREGHTNPWPDGAVFAKIAWDQLPDSSGTIYAGAYKQVEFMIRDAQRYDTSFGWGFARWVGGLALHPYGKDGSFVTECINCHRPVAKTDHTFTIPVPDTLGLYDQAAAVPDAIGTHPLTGKVITTLVSPKDGSMSTLYGNDLAVKSARTGQAYPAGAIISLVTWSQRDDPHWFGGRIPAALQSVEMVNFITPAAAPAYEKYEGSALKKAAAGTDVALRIQYITGLKAAVLP
jgi:hypothetical protein